MADDCVFCGIIEGSIPGRPVYRDEAVHAFLDVNPLSRGHTLVVPTSHHETVADLPDTAGEALFTALFRLVPAVERAVEADGSTIGFNNGTAAGQEIPHVHGHVVPRFRADRGGSLHSMMGGPREMTDAELDATADRIRDHL